jgi:rubrerythrin
MAMNKQIALLTKGLLAPKPICHPDGHFPLDLLAPLTPFLRRCGQVFTGTSYARQLAGHEAHCVIPGAAPPHIPCRRNCGKTFEWRFKQEGKKHFHHAREFRNLHERISRGTDEATRTCPSCLKVFRAGVTDETIWLHRSKCASQNPPNSEICTYPSRKMNKCPNCKSKFSIVLEDHLKHCRGDIKSNKTCQACELVLQTIDARVKHEEV